MRRKTVLELAVVVMVVALLPAAAQDDGDCIPREVHIALGRDETEMVVSWRTTSSEPCPSRVWVHRASGPGVTAAAAAAAAATAAAAAPSASPALPGAGAAVAAADAALRHKVRRFNDAQQEDQDDDPAFPPNAVGESYLLSNTDMCGSPANSRPFSRHLHRARLSALVPGAYYRYAVDGGGRAGGSPAIFGFRAAPRPGPGHTVSLAVVGDVGWSHHEGSKSPGADAVLRGMAADVDEGLVDAVLHVGDVAYADGSVEVWDGFMASIGGQGGAGGGGGGDGGEQPEGGDSSSSSSSPKSPNYGSLAARVPYFISVGNHEYSYEEGWDHTDPSGGRPYSPSWANWGNDSGGECGAMVARRFWMPRGGGGGGGVRGGYGGGSNANDSDGDHPLDLDVFEPKAPAAASSSCAKNGGAADNNATTTNASPPLPPPRALPPFWYSFDYGSVHVAVISSEHDLTPGSRQGRWLEEDLRSVDRCATPWLVLAVHRPLYVVYPHKSNRYVGDHMRASLEPLLRRYRVDAAVSGHVHVFYRSCPVVAAGDGGEGGGTDGRCVDEGDRDSGAMSRADAVAIQQRRQQQLKQQGGLGGGASANASATAANEGEGGGDGSHFGTVHLVVGSGGHKLSGASGAQPRWVRALYDRDYGYLRIEAQGGERLVVEFVSPASQEKKKKKRRGHDDDDGGGGGGGGDSGPIERRVLDRATYEGGAHHAMACAESRDRRRADNLAAAPAGGAAQAQARAAALQRAQQQRQRAQAQQAVY